MRNIDDMTLDEIWEECIRMWTWIVRMKKKYPCRSVAFLKSMWMRINGYSDVSENCFFCHFVRWWDDPRCAICPGALVKRGWRCTEDCHNYTNMPELFLASLIELDAKRKELP